MRVVVSGASGMVGTALRASLAEDGHEVVRLVRRDPRGPDEVRWDPASGPFDPAVLDGADAVVNLSGANIGGRRWTAAYRRELVESRLGPTRTLAAAVAAHDGRVAMVNASGVGAYGSDRGEEVLTEQSTLGSGFLAGLVADWERATEPAAAAGARVAFARCGLIQTRRGGAFRRTLPLFQCGLGGCLGNGRQWWSTISLRDAIRGYRFLLETDASGPCNVAAPPTRNRDFTAAMGSVLRRPTPLPVPAVALRVVLGDLAADVLGSQRVQPQRLLDAGFTFKDPDATAIVRSALAD